MDISPEEVYRAKTDEEAFSGLLKRSERFIGFTIFKTLHRFISRQDDEWSIAIIAFHEAVKSYQEPQGKFKTFAGLVIKRRLLDYLDSEKRHRNEIAVEPMAMGGEIQSDEDEGSVSAISLETAQKNAELSQQSSKIPGQNPMRDEIEAVQQLLQGYGFSFFDLAECSPKAQKTKLAVAAAVRALISSDEMMKSMREKRKLPMKALAEESGVSLKILEHHRRYIIAAAEILNGEYPLLAAYMDYIKKGLT